MFDALRAIGRPITMGTMNGMTRYLGNAAMQSTIMQLTLGIAFEVLFPMAFFCLLPLFCRDLRRLARPSSLESLVGRALAARRQRLKHARNGQFCSLKSNSCVYVARRSFCVDKSAGNGRR